MEKIFIAGGTGMLGAATARAFAAAQMPVVVSTRKDRDAVGETLEAESDFIQVERVDLLDAESVQTLFAKHDFTGVVMVVHTHQYAKTRNTNNEIYPITINCLEIARRHGVKRVVFGGSMAVYGGLTPPFTEDIAFPPEVTAASAADKDLMLKFEVATKRALEIITLDYGEEFQMGLSVPPGTEKPEPHELEVVVLRAPMMFGPGYQALGSPLGVAAHVAAGRLTQFNGHIGYGGAPIEKFWAGLASMPTNYVKDNAECIQVAMAAEKLTRKIYNIDSEFSRSPRAQLEALISVKPECADRMGIKPEDLPEAEFDLGFNSSLFRQDFGWTSKYTLETALADYLGWLRDNPY
ncbi:MAG: NAD(P)-dependent oxidoreductase [Pseudomonadota bacterium]